MQPEFDARDQAILDARQAAFLAVTRIKVGDFVRFPDGSERRATYVWPDEQGNADGIQTGSVYGSYYLGDGYMDYSGSLYHCQDARQFERTGEFKQGRAWFFHHDYHRAFGGIDVLVNCPVWICREEAKS